jgi:membrane protease YdiL (CAAX protease family)
VWVIAAFVLQGGLSGYAQSLQENAIRPLDLLSQAVLQVVIALLGVGLALRRTLSGVLERLALRLPTSADLVWGVGVGFLFIVLMFVFSALWAALTTPEVFTEQTQAVSQLNAAFATLPLAFVVALSAAVGEEIWIRGALQPVFGIVLTSVFFTVLHTQVALTPATLLIFALSLGLGWLRQRYSTTTAIVAHFVYNFIPLALLSVIPGVF